MHTRGLSEVEAKKHGGNLGETNLGLINLWWPNILMPKRNARGSDECSIRRRWQLVWMDSPEVVRLSRISFLEC